MRRTIAVALAVGLLAGLMALPAEAQRRRQPKPVDLTYYLRNVAAEGCDALQLLLETSDEGGSCGNLLSGPGNSALMMMGEEPAGMTYPAGEGLPFVLNARKDLTGTINVMSYRGAAANPGGLSGGLTTFTMAVTLGTPGGSVELEPFEANYAVTPAQQVYEVPFEIEIPTNLNNRRVTSMSVFFYNHGPAPLHGFYQVNTSTIEVPTWRR